MQPSHAAFDEPDKCSTCNRPGWLTECEHAEGCHTRHHFWCLGLAFPLAEDEEYVCVPCGGPPVRAPSSSEENNFECVICFETKPAIENVIVHGCNHDDHVCSKCMFVEIYDHRPKCPLCRRDATAVVQVITQRRHDVIEDDGEEEEGEEDEDEGEDAQLSPIDNAIVQIRNGESRIDLNSKSLDDDDAKKLAPELAVAPSLQVLNLTNNYITWKGAQALANALLFNSKLGCPLQRLHLDGNNLDDRAAIRLAQCFDALAGKNNTLRLLTLCDNERIGRRGLEALRGAQERRAVQTALRVIVPWHAEEEEEEEAEVERQRAAHRRVAKRQREHRREAEADEEDEEDDDDEERERERDDQMRRQEDAMWSM